MEKKMYDPDALRPFCEPPKAAPPTRMLWALGIALFLIVVFVVV
jgi:hypothetical protein